MTAAASTLLAPTLDHPAPATGPSRTLVVHVNDATNPFDTYVGRGVRTARDPRARVRSVWANPWKVGEVPPGRRSPRTLGEALWLYETVTLVDIRDELGPDGWRAALAELAGKRLGCWCARPGQVLTAEDPHPRICHGQLLAGLCDRAVML